MAEPLLQTSSPSILFRDGKLVPAEADPEMADVGSGGFYETFRTMRGRPHLWAHHRRRLQHACDRAGVRLPDSFLWRDEPRFLAVVRQLLEANRVKDAVFRYALLTPSTGGGGEALAESLTARVPPPAAPAEGVALRVLKVRRDRAEWLPRPKRLNCPIVAEGRRELQARAKLPSDEGLFLSGESEFVVETANQNVGWVDGGCLYYPEPSTGAVAGTCLAWLMESDMRPAPRGARLDEVLGAEAIVVFNSVRGFTPVGAVYGRDDELLVRIASAEHPVVARLHQLWSDELQRTETVT